VKRLALAVVTLAIVAQPLLADGKRTDAHDQWGQWRGPLATGVAPRADPPLTWSEASNVRWKVPVPGLGHSSPIVWGDRVFVTTAVPFGEAEAFDDAHVHSGAHHNLSPNRQQKFIVLAFDRADGTIVWQRTLRTERPHEGTHVTGSWASGSPVTDGEVLIVSFGSRGLYGLDMQGELLWKVSLGEMQTLHGHGEGSSPVLHRDRVFVNWDHQGESFLMALNKRTGKQLWRVARDEDTSWSTPLVVKHDGKYQLIVAATGRVRSYDTRNGKLIWECGGLARNVVASPVAADGMVFVTNSYDRQAMLAIRLAGATGDITGSDAVVWRRSRDTPYVSSPLLHGDALCFLKHNQAFFTCVNPKDGSTLYGPRRLAGIRQVFASPVGAAGRVYIADRDGTTLVLKQGASFEPLATNQLEDSFSASPAAAGNELFLRGEHHLYCLAE